MLGDGSLWALPSDSLLDLFRSYLNDPLDKRRGQRVIGCEPDDSLAGVKRGEFIPSFPTISPCMTSKATCCFAALKLTRSSTL